ncbi:MAG: RNA polymerase sigma factor [Traorella sp.]
MHHNTDKFDRIYEQTIHDISKYVVIHCENIEDVKDILQEIYLEVFRKIQKNIDIDIKYIYGISKHKINDYYRFSYKNKILSLFTKNENEIEIIDTIPDENDLERNIFLHIESESIWNYLLSKPVIISKIFYLYYYEELSIKEISIELKLTEFNVKNYIYRTIKELRKKYESEE